MAIILDSRLSKLAECVGVCETCADIGTDHGRLGAFLLQTGKCERMTFTDISAPSLEKAVKLIRLLALEEKADFRAGNGLHALCEPADVIVIAGMGGETMATILTDGRDRLAGAKLVLQPNTDADMLRRALCGLGYTIETETIVRDGRRLYVVITASEGSMTLDEREAVIGPLLLKERPAILDEYRDFKLRVLAKALKGAQSGRDEVAVEALEHEHAIWETLL